MGDTRLDRFVRDLASGPGRTAAACHPLAQAALAKAALRLRRLAFPWPDLGPVDFAHVFPLNFVTASLTIVKKRLPNPVSFGSPDR
jgi:hypothetical protein